MIQATCVTKDEFHDNNIPGSFYISDPDPTDQEQNFWYQCPCGCGRKGLLIVGNKFKPPHDGQASWEWNGDLASATLIPSVHHVGHWHGFLTNGVWKEC